jgi:hypothetical protein
LCRQRPTCPRLHGHHAGRTTNARRRRQNVEYLGRQPIEARLLRGGTASGRERQQRDDQQQDK